MIYYIEKVLFPNMERAREGEDLLLSLRDILIFNVYAGHRGQALLDLLDRKDIIVVFVSPHVHILFNHIL